MIQGELSRKVVAFASFPDARRGAVNSPVFAIWKSKTHHGRGRRHQLCGLAVSAKRYVVYSKKKTKKLLNRANTDWELFMFLTSAPATNLQIAKISKPIRHHGLSRTWGRLLTNQN